MATIYPKSMYPYNPIDALEYYVCLADGISDFCKKTLLWMIRRSNFLTKGVCLTFPPEFRMEAKETAHGFHDIVSCNLKIRLDLFLCGMGRRMFFSHHAGHFTRHVSGQLPDREYDFGGFGNTVWLAPRYFDDEVETYLVDQKLIDEINLLELRNEMADFNRRFNPGTLVDG